MPKQGRPSSQGYSDARIRTKRPERAHYYNNNGHSAHKPLIFMEPFACKLRNHLAVLLLAYSIVLRSYIHSSTMSLGWSW
jgi:hypothetical protein